MHPLLARVLRATTVAMLAMTLVPAVAQAQASSSAPYPEAQKRAVSDTYAGVAGPRKVTEDYRWLENLDDPAVKDWVTAQNAATRRTLDASAQRPIIRDELQRLIGNAPVARSGFHYAGGKLFALKRQPPKNQPMLVMLDADVTNADALADERVVLDPNLRNDKGTTAIDWFVPSHDGRLVAVSLSDNGSEEGSLHVFESATGNELSDVIPRVQKPTGGGSAAWNADASGIWYTRYPAPMERAAEDAGFYQQVWFHQLGTRATQDRKVLGDALNRIAETALESSSDGRQVLASVSDGDGGDVGFWLRGPNDQWRRIADFADGVRRATFGPDGRLYALVIKDSPRGRIVAMKLDAPSLAKATTVVRESDATIEDFVATTSRLYVETLVGGPSEIRVFSLAGKSLPAPVAERVSAATIGTRLGGDAILFGEESFITPFAWFRLDPQRDGGKPVRTALTAPPADVAMGALEVRREMVRSRDGTQVPVNIVSRKGIRLDGSNPVLLTAYGGFSLSRRPYYSRRVMFWLGHGGIFVLANIRGGSEFGEEWHEGGRLTKKQNVFDDFAAAARYLIDDGYTRAAKLAIEGGSNGGLLMGAELVQHPELYGAVVSHVGIYDMLRNELTANGSFNAAEFGSVKDPAQFDALYAYSPLHHVVDGTAYPPVLMTTGINDGRVAPWQSLKMTARLQAANPKGRPVLLRVAGDAGHGQGMSLSSAIELDADTFTFIFDSLGMSTTQSAPAPLPTAGPGLPETK